MNTRGALLIALACLPLSLTGCVADPPLPHNIHIAGVHHRWDADDTVTITASVINIGGRTLPGDVGIETVVVHLGLYFWGGANGTSGGVDATEFRFPEDWSPGRSETLSLTIPVGRESDRAYYVMVQTFVDYGDGLEDETYRSECFNRAGPLSESCEATYNRTGLSMDPREEAWRERMIACCQWLPPPLDVANFTCSTGTEARRCQLTLYNWKEGERTPSIEYRVIQTTASGDQTEIGRGRVQTSGAAIAPRAYQTFTFDLEGLASLPSNPAATREVEVNVAVETAYEGNLTAWAPIVLREVL